MLYTNLNPDINYASGLMIHDSNLNKSDYINQKVETLWYHTTEYEKYNGEMWLDSLLSMAKYRGLQLHIKYAEAFHLMKYLLI